MQLLQKIRPFLFPQKGRMLFQPVLMGGILSVIALAPSQGGQSSESAETEPQNQLCAKYIAHYQEIEDIPSHLLTAISLVESGRWDDNKKQKSAWPWTVMAEGKGAFFPTKALAVAKVKGLQNRGISNIDVGCMQVNLRYHGKAFTSVEQALEPSANVAYAARYLKDLRKKNKSWAQAVAYYHSATWDLNRPYSLKVIGYWNKAWRQERIDSLTRELDEIRLRRERTQQAKPSP
jgi:hypothetical protein